MSDDIEAGTFVDRVMLSAAGARRRERSGMFIRALAAVVLLGCLVVIALELMLLASVRGFEWPYLWRLLGARGVLLILVLELGGVALTWCAWRVLRRRPLGSGQRKAVAGLLVVSAAAAIWLVDWVLLETPVTVRLRDGALAADALNATAQESLQYARRSGDLNALASGTGADERALAIMVARTVINRPDAFAAAPLGKTLAQYGARYGVDPIVPFYWAYLDSFYGEAVSGPMPFFAELNAETFRDLVQVHLPSWFVESSLRARLIEGTTLESVFGQGFGNKLRYALQKATYDVSVDPFDTNIFADVFVVLREYPAEFPELAGSTQRPLIDRELAGTFARLRGTVMVPPYADPFATARHDSHYYDEHRQDLVTFARAAFYKMLFDFDFAARVQTLVAKYYADAFRRDLGAQVWDGMSAEQRAALLAMLRDVYTPNIGKLGYDLYLLPEFNNTPYSFMLVEARKGGAALGDAQALWRPSHGEYLWAATAFKLRVLGEVWHAAKAQPFANLPAEATTDSALVAVARNRSRLTQVPP